ncbi:acylphosphatase [Patescibacteria group bacterium]|nr:acylphosphatase [Patescibacteria group bacterium]
MIRAHVFIEGRVHGIGFRYWVRKNAQGLGLTGWVRNLADGRVEAVFEGAKKDVEDMIKKCKRGPMLAGVKHIDINWEEATGEFEGFGILPTAET